jgi:hypothetical protein
MPVVDIMQIGPLQNRSHPYSCRARQLLAATVADIDAFLRLCLQSLTSSLIDTA